MSIRDQLEKLAEKIEKNETVHLKINGSGKNACRSRSSMAIDVLTREANLRRINPGYRHYGDWESDQNRQWLLRIKSYRGWRSPSHYSLDICLSCQSALRKQCEEEAAQVLKNSKNRTQGILNRVARSPEKPKDYFKEPERPIGTEYMTGHLADGPNGACGEGGTGFMTLFIPWVQCPGCLVILDDGIGNGIYSLIGLYLRTKDDPPEPPRGDGEAPQLAVPRETTAEEATATEGKPLSEEPNHRED